MPLSSQIIESASLVVVYVSFFKKLTPPALNCFKYCLSIGVVEAFESAISLMIPNENNFEVISLGNPEKSDFVPHF